MATLSDPESSSGKVPSNPSTLLPSKISPLPQKQKISKIVSGLYKINLTNNTAKELVEEYVSFTGKKISENDEDLFFDDPLLIRHENVNLLKLNLGMQKNNNVVIFKDVVSFLYVYKKDLKHVDIIDILDDYLPFVQKNDENNKYYFVNRLYINLVNNLNDLNISLRVDEYYSIFEYFHNISLYFMFHICSKYIPKNINIYINICKSDQEIDDINAKKEHFLVITQNNTFKKTPEKENTYLNNIIGNYTRWIHDIDLVKKTVNDFNINTSKNMLLESIFRYTLKVMDK